MSDKVTVIIRSGFASKCGGMVKSWKRRWFVLKSNGFLYYYETANCKSEKGKIDVISAGEVSLLKKEVAAASSLPSNLSPSNSFSVVSGGRTYICVCDSSDDASAWVEAINQFRLPNKDQGYPPPTYAKTEPTPAPLPTKVQPQTQYSASQPSPGFASQPTVPPQPAHPPPYAAPQAGPPMPQNMPPPYGHPGPHTPYGHPGPHPPYGPTMPQPQYPPQQPGYFRPPPPHGPYYYPQGPPPRPAYYPPPGGFPYYQPRPPVQQQSSVNVTVINI